MKTLFVLYSFNREMFIFNYRWKKKKGLARTIRARLVIAHGLSSSIAFQMYTHLVERDLKSSSAEFCRALVQKSRSINSRPPL